MNGRTGRTGLFGDTATFAFGLDVPGINGREPLSVVTSDDNLGPAPVIVMTHADDERDIDGCSRDDANSYVHKTLARKAFLEAARRLEDDRFETAMLPKV